MTLLPTQRVYETLTNIGGRSVETLTPSLVLQLLQLLELLLLLLLLDRLLGVCSVDDCFAAEDELSFRLLELESSESPTAATERIFFMFSPLPFPPLLFPWANLSTGKTIFNRKYGTNNQLFDVMNHVYYVFHFKLNFKINKYEKRQ